MDCNPETRTMSNKKIKHPNIVLICSDQHNPEVTGCYGNEIIDTPNFDRLASEGIRFDAAYCSSPLCVPSRMSFLTGLYPFKNGATNNSCILSSTVMTFAHAAAAGGYRTVLSGRMHFKGPDQYHGYLERIEGDVAPYFHYNGKVPAAPLMPDLGNMSKSTPMLQTGSGKTYVQQYDQDVTDATCTWLDNYSQQAEHKPFLMTVGLFAPHCPYIVTPEYYEKYRDIVGFENITADELSGLHPAHRGYIRQVNLDVVPDENKRRAKIAYYGLVDFTDNLTGRILRSLENNNLLNNTIIVYFSDHGDLIGEHGRWHKGCFFEGSARVPLIIRLPRSEHAGRVVADNVSLIDLYPTICDWIGSEADHPVDGHSLVPLINGSSTDRPNLVKSEYYEGPQGCRRMIKLDAWKYVYYHDYEQEELFNLDQDPSELRNLADQPEHAALVAELRKKVFEDGWNGDIIVEEDEWNNRVGYSGKIMRQFAQTTCAEQNHVENCPGYWRRAQTEKIANHISTP